MRLFASHLPCIPRYVEIEKGVCWGTMVQYHKILANRRKGHVIGRDERTMYKWWHSGILTEDSMRSDINNGEVTRLGMGTWREEVSSAMTRRDPLR